MALTFPDGAIVGFSTATAAPIPFTAITNAAVPEITTAGSIAEDSILVVQSGWPSLNNRAVVAGATLSTETELIGINTTDTELFPAGRGVGTVAIASSFVDFSQQGELTSGGGEPQLYTGKWLEDPLGQEFQGPSASRLAPTACRWITTKTWRGSPQPRPSPANASRS